ncbi:hypothetical protein BH24PSE2_BH24PSE2_11780 [soil metagenome]
MQPDAKSADPRGRAQLLRDVLVFQLKLFVDGLRDLVLVPVSLVAALADLLGSGDHAGQRFYEVVRFGRRTERWIRLFAAADHLDDPPEDAAPENLDEIMNRVELRLRQRYMPGEPEKGSDPSSKKGD